MVPPLAREVLVLWSGFCSLRFAAAAEAAAILPSNPGGSQGVDKTRVKRGD